MNKARLPGLHPSYLYRPIKNMDLQPGSAPQNLKVCRFFSRPIMSFPLSSSAAAAGVPHNASKRSVVSSYPDPPPRRLEVFVSIADADFEEVVYSPEMALNETDRGWIKNAITEALREHARGWLERIRQWGPLGAVVALFIFSLNEFVKYVEFRTHTNDQFEKVLSQLGSLRAVSSANQPLSKQNQEAAKQLLAEVRSNAIPPIPLKTIEQTGQSFANAGVTDPGAWSVTLDCLRYISFLSRQPPLLRSRTDLGLGGWPMEVPGRFLSIGEFGETDSESRAVSELIVSPKDYSNVRVAPPKYITFTLSDPKLQDRPDADIKLDGFRLRGVVFRDLHIVYHGGPLRMDNVWFVNCTFSIDRQKPGFGLANQFLSSSETSSQITFESEGL
jgi:hypothetical protein